MNEITTKSLMPKSSVNIENRERISLSGIVKVESFDEGEVTARLDTGSVTVFGQGLHVTRLDPEGEILVVDGFISGVEFSDSQKSGGIISRLFK